ncbi:hypothetical protein HMP09_3273 [Sphingomonas sp. HMP9]|uniref:LysR substrate-binding domain-containing protein n=1 Tax=Sphingomonas sp. HMP9 TaxID=1517554 RepID=UPI00159A007B|nr:LysR substrate-binding domain-containing protein [Sphingomonas sp. HMP9]BCA64039.1 hypothetical protein HMP09_3273 [Sphingomonas sp. HMP9]
MVDLSGAALEGLDQLRTTPGGKIRINAVVDAVTLVLGPVLAELSRRHPDIEVDLVSRNRIVDVVGEGFDAGMRYGGTVPEDMIAQRLSADLRWVVAASPRYLDEHGTPTHPDELKHHRCFGVRLGDDSIYRWEFERPDGDFDVPIKSAMTADDSRSTLAMALNGAGLTFGLEPLFAKHVADGNLRLVLTDWATTGPGFYLIKRHWRTVFGFPTSAIRSGSTSRSTQNDCRPVDAVHHSQRALGRESGWRRRHSTSSKTDTQISSVNR